MQFINDSPWDADLLRTELPGERMMASLLVRVAYAIGDGGQVRLLDPAAQAGAWGGVRRDQVPTPFGDLEPDLVFPRTATDVISLGHAVAPEPVRHARVDLAVGPYRQSLVVHGDRVWERGPFRRLHATEAEPFIRMPLGWSQAYGGAAPGPYGPLPCPVNPRGRGFNVDEDQAVDRPLPNVEWSDALVREPLDQPEPAIVGPYPSSWWLRLQKVWVAAPERYSVDLHPEQGLFDQAHPRLSGQNVRPGETILIRGMGPDLRAVVPPCPAAAEFILGDAQCPRTLELEEVLIDTTQRVLALAWRKCVQYQYIREQPRTTILREARA